MSSLRPISAEDGSRARLRREDHHQRSLRECTTLTHYFSNETRQRQAAPVLTSRVQWDNDRIDKDDDVPSTLVEDDHDMHRIKEAVVQSYPSPVLSEVDDLTLSDGERSQSLSRPSTRNGAYDSPLAKAVEAGSPHSYTDSSDTERRNPNFPGGRDIIDDNTSSGSPSPPTAPRTQLEPASPTIGVPRRWRQSLAPNTSSSLDLRLYPNQTAPTRDERNTRIGIWRTDSAPQSFSPGPSSLARYSSNGLNQTPTYRSTSYSPSLSASSVPPSPPPVLPPIRPHPSLRSQALPSVARRLPGPMYWGSKEQSPPSILKRLSAHGHDSADEYDYGDLASFGRSPNMHAHTLHGLPHSYPPRFPDSLAPRAPATPRNKNAWKEHAQVVHGPNDQTEFRCVWRVANTGSETDFCGYTAKRHLVKRHVETRHLQFKDHICPYCSKAFPQRVSLMIHVNRHTGEKPHKCRFDGCDKTFSDPARRHKHMVEVHGYNPQGPRKRHRTTDSYHANSHFETLAPWVAKPEDPDGETRALKAADCT